MIAIKELDAIRSELQNSQGCQNMKARVESEYRLSLSEKPLTRETVERIVTIAEIALQELYVVRIIEERHDI